MPDMTRIPVSSAGSRNHGVDRATRRRRNRRRRSIRSSAAGRSRFPTGRAARPTRSVRTARRSSRAARRSPRPCSRSRPSQRSSGFYKWTDKLVKDNGKKDCSGEITEVGQTATNYVQFHPSGNIFIMCADEIARHVHRPVQAGARECRSSRCLRTMRVPSVRALALAALPVPALAAGLESLPGLSGANLSACLGAAVRGVAAVDRDRAARQRAFLARAFRQDRRCVVGGADRAVRADIRRRRHAPSPRARGRRGVPSVRRHPVRALHDRRRHLRARLVRRHAGAQHRHPRARRRDREPHGHDRARRCC